MSDDFDARLKRIHPANYINLVMAAGPRDRPLTGVDLKVLRWFSGMAFSTAQKARVNGVPPPAPFAAAWFCEAACAKEIGHDIKSARVSFGRLVKSGYLSEVPDCYHVMAGSGKRRQYFQLDLAVVGLGPSGPATGQNARHDSDHAGRLARFNRAERPVVPGETPGDLRSGSGVMIDPASFSKTLRSPGVSPGSPLYSALPGQGLVELDRVFLPDGRPGLLVKGQHLDHAVPREDWRYPILRAPEDGRPGA